MLYIIGIKNIFKLLIIHFYILVLSVYKNNCHDVFINMYFVFACRFYIYCKQLMISLSKVDS